MGPRMSASLCCISLLLGGCGEQADAPPTPILDEAFTCSQTLIGRETASCREDFVGPGELTISFQPDPKETSWEIGVRGLAALAEQCEFHGRFDQTRLSALQGRGETHIVCAIAPSLNRQYHELRFENLLEAPSTAIHVRVTLAR